MLNDGLSSRVSRSNNFFMIKPKDGRFWTGLIKKYLISIMPVRNVCRTPESEEVGEAETVFNTDKNQLAPAEEASEYGMSCHRQRQDSS